MMKSFQILGAEFLAARTRALLADEPGVGKTAQVVRACELVGARRVLVVCPAIGITHWSREFKRWSVKRPSRLYIVSYENARELIPNERYDVLVVDECHYAKNPLAQRAKAIFGKQGLGWHADRIWALSGTPAPNNAAELWPMLRAFNATDMNYDQFVQHFCRVDWQGKIRGTRKEAADELRGILKPYSLRRLKKDVLPELGEIDVQEWYVKPNADFILERGLPRAHSHEVEKQSYALGARLKDMSQDERLAFLTSDHEFATLRRYNALLKAPAVFEQVMFEMDNGLVDKVVVYGYHKEALEVLWAKFSEAGIGTVLINGDTPVKERDGLVQHWKRRPGGARVMLASIIAAGVVLDFTEAHQGIMLELDWVPGNNAQAMQRMHRHGQTQPVTVRVAIGSEIDEIVSDVVLRKTRELTAIFG